MVTVELLCTVGRMPAPVVSAVVTATQAAVANAVRHAGVDLVCVMGRLDPRGDLVVVVRDEGVGFDPSSRSGFGLVGALDRPVTDIGGVTSIRSGEGFGTLVRIQFPAEILQLLA
ncbi:hypothetical protein BH23ACT9_BH23ACT9_10820 [soil metagenome]